MAKTIYMGWPSSGGVNLRLQTSTPECKWLADGKSYLAIVKLFDFS
jgi:hypothetical protein